MTIGKRLWAARRDLGAGALLFPRACRAYDMG